MKRFQSAGETRRLLSIHDQITNPLPLCRDPVPATEYRAARARVPFRRKRHASIRSSTKLRMPSASGAVPHDVLALQKERELSHAS
jgi:hypothetical protein